MSTIFDKIIRGELPAEKVYEDDVLLAIKDIYPLAPVHLLIIPKKAYRDLQAIPKEDANLMVHVLALVQKLAVDLNIAEGYRLVTNNGASAGQVIFHLHFHLIGGGKLNGIA